MKKKILSVFLSITLLILLTPVNAMAKSDSDNDVITDEVQSFDESKIKFNESNPGQPVWLISHRCNTNVVNALRRPIAESKSDIQHAIDGGCNGVEVDIRKSTWKPTKGNIILCHDTGITERYTETLEQFLSMNVWNQHKIHLVVYDIKEPEHIDELINVTHKYTQDRNKFDGVYFIYSVGKLDEAKNYFPKNVGKLAPYEGIEVDMDWNTPAYDVESFYQSIGFDRCWYGNGIDSFVPFKGFQGGKIERNCKCAVDIRDGNTTYGPNSKIKKVESWSINRQSAVLEMIGNWKLNALLVGGKISYKRIKVKSNNTKVPLASVLLSEINKQHPDRQVYLANGNNNPFMK